ncbi:hypothetical protein QZH41_004012 [Actinostola sp. cb2023]|nr:hypothetical protein QZH41_004012 [Actinostola sp. cb2023]
MRMGKTATHLQALTTYPIILNLRRQEQYAVEVNVQGHKDMGGKEDNPKDEVIETFLRKIAAKLPKELGTEISKTPVTVTLYGKDGTDPKECEWDAETTRFKEKQWFSNHKQYSDLMHICGIDRLMETMANVVSKIFSEKQAETMTFIKQFIQMQKKSVDAVGVSILLPQDIDNAVKNLISTQYTFQTKHQGKVAYQVPSPPPEPELFTQIRHLSKRLHCSTLVANVMSCSIVGESYKDREQIINTKKNVISCFNTIKLNVIDTVPRCIQHFFVTQLVESLTKELESTDLMEFLQEKEDVTRRRDKSQRTLDSIEYNLPQAEKITSMLLRIKQGRSAFTP